MEKIILETDANAAQKVILTTLDGTKYGEGWVSINRKFFPLEDMARYDSFTHKECSTCKGIYKKNSYCKNCYAQRRKEVYDKLSFMEWDGTTPLVLFDDDKYFYDEDSIIDYCEENEITVADLKLCICEPNYLTPISYEIWCDLFPEDSDGELPEEVEVALKEFNEVLKRQKPISWSKGKFRTTIITTI